MIIVFTFLEMDKGSGFILSAIKANKPKIVTVTFYESVLVSTF